MPGRDRSIVVNRENIQHIIDGLDLLISGLDEMRDALEESLGQNEIKETAIVKDASGKRWVNEDEVLHEAEALVMVAERLASHEWWVFLPGLEVGIRIMKAIEERFYPMDPNVDPTTKTDFQVLVTPPTRTGFFTIGFGKKSRLSSEVLAEFLNQVANPYEGGPVTAAILEKQDILFLADMPEQAKLGLRFATWINNAIANSETLQKKQPDDFEWPSGL